MQLQILWKDISNMAEHMVKVKLPSRVEVLSKDLEVEVRSNGRLVGTLKISKGSLDWRDAADQYSRVLRWQKFADIAVREGKKKRRK
jgi:hypothetical protein